MEIKIQEAVEYLNIIDLKYLEAKKNKISRFDVKWGVWSVVLNKELRSKEKENCLLTLVFMYWVTLSKLLEMHYKFKFFKQNAKNKLRKEAETIKKRIKSGEEVSFEMMDIVKTTPWK